MNEIREEESIADRLCKGITDYLIRISSLAINEKEHQHVASLLQIVSDIERISDYCENISEYAENLANQKKEVLGCRGSRNERDAGSLFRQFHLCG